MDNVLAEQAHVVGNKNSAEDPRSGSIALWGNGAVGPNNLNPVPWLCSVNKIFIKNDVNRARKLSSRGLLRHFLDGNSLEITINGQAILSHQQVAFFILEKSTSQKRKEKKRKKERKKKKKEKKEEKKRGKEVSEFNEGRANKKKKKKKKKRKEKKRKEARPWWDKSLRKQWTVQPKWHPCSHGQWSFQLLRSNEHSCGLSDAPENLITTTKQASQLANVQGQKTSKKKKKKRKKRRSTFGDDSFKADHGAKEASRESSWVNSVRPKAALKPNMKITDGLGLLHKIRIHDRENLLEHLLENGNMLHGSCH
jgi:hypothetical protein